MAVADPTTNYTWKLPDVGADTGSWGAMLRAIIGDDGDGSDSPGLDKVIKSVADQAAAAMPKVGGDFTGVVKVHTDKYVAVADAGFTGLGETLDLSTSRFFHGPVTGNVTFVFSTPGTGTDACFFILQLTNAGGSTITWPTSVKWPGGISPGTSALPLTDPGVDVFSFYTVDNGATWRGALTQQDSR